MRPHELKGANVRTEEPDGELEMDVRVFDLDHFEKKLALIVDMHRWLQNRAVVNNLMRDRVQQARRRLCLKPRYQQLGRLYGGFGPVEAVFADPSLASTS